MTGLVAGAIHIPKPDLTKYKHFMDLARDRPQNGTCGGNYSGRPTHEISRILGQQPQKDHPPDHSHTDAAMP